MTPAAIIRQAAADGVRLTLTTAGTIRAVGNGAAVERWVPIIRQHKPDIVAELQAANDAGNDTLSDPIAEARRRRVLAMLAERAEARYALVTDTDADPEAVILTLAIRGAGTCELHIPKAKYDGVLLLDLIERHGATLH